MKVNFNLIELFCLKKITFIFILFLETIKNDR